MRATPVHLCRLRYFGDEQRWGFGFFAYSSEKYELRYFRPDSSSVRRKMLSRSRRMCICGELLRIFNTMAADLESTALRAPDGAAKSPKHRASTSQVVELGFEGRWEPSGAAGMTRTGLMLQVGVSGGSSKRYHLSQSHEICTRRSPDSRRSRRAEAVAVSA